MNRNVYFNLPPDNPEKLTEFYCNAFGWTKHQDYWKNPLSVPSGKKPLSPIENSG